MSTENIETPERAGDVLVLPVAANTHIYAGTLVARNATGYAVPASDAAGLRVVGRAEREVDNSGGAAGDVQVAVKRGVFLYANSAGEPVVASGIGGDCYVKDAATVSSVPGTNSVVAGKVVAIEDDRVWVDTVPALYADVSAR